MTLPFLRLCCAPTCCVLAFLLVVSQAQADPFGFIDIQPDGGRVESGATPLLSAPTAGTNGQSYPISSLNVGGQPITLTISTVDWRDRGDSTNTDPLVLTGEDFVKNNGGTVIVGLGNLPAGTYQATSYHADPGFTQSEAIQVFVSDAVGSNTDTGATGNANVDFGGVNGLTTAGVSGTSANFSFVSDGLSPVALRFDGMSAADTEVPLNGLDLQFTPAAETPGLRDYAIVDFGSAGQRVEAGGSAVTSTDLTTVTAADGSTFEVQVSNGGNSGSIDLRDRGNSNNPEQFVLLTEDHFKNNAGFVQVDISGLAAGEYQVLSFHADADFTQSEAIDVLVTDADSVMESVATGDSSFDYGDVNGLNTADLLANNTATFGITSNGSDPISILFDGSAAADTEVPVNGLIIRQFNSGAAPIPEPHSLALWSIVSICGLGYRASRLRR